ncbi:MAG: pectin acetylesterase-family hydrolase [Deltaproteobacteria bacterium]|nr:pectin acetylesterase-family hydrolase [Deltaproteobacteria bacterium]
MRSMRLSRCLLMVSLALGLAACGDDDHRANAPTATPTPVATASATAVPTATAPPPPSATATAIPTATAPPTASATVPPSATATATPPPSLVEELRAAGVGRYLGAITPASMQPNGVWDSYRFDPAAAQAICLRGDAYRVEVKRGTTNKVLLYLEGGGACWDNDSCWVAPTAKLTADPIFGAGIFDFANPDNPFRDWNIVYAPYCDGSVFGGDNLVAYENGLVYHHGQQNLAAAVDVMRDQFRNPAQIVVAGSSAGGYGTFSGYGVVRVAYPDTPIVTLNDSGPGLQNAADVQGVQDRVTNWRYTEVIPPSCTRCAEQVAFLTEWGLARDPSLRVGYFSTLRDVVIRSFLRLEPPAYEALLRETTDALHAAFPDRFKRFFIQGEGHTILELPQFFGTEVLGLSVRDWTADILTDGDNWQDVIEPFNPFPGYSSPRYVDENLWLCRAGKSDDQCLVNALDVTDIGPDLTLDVQPHFPADEPPDVDCFYVYPTVDLAGPVGNHTDFSDISLELDPLLNQAARLNTTCRIFAPLYRQGTLSSFGAPEPQRTQIFDLAYADVLEAFKHYMGQYNQGRNVVIMGHSQGTQMITRLLQEVVDPEPQLRARLVVALAIGGNVVVPDGQTVGGSFHHLPLCTSAEQTGCVIAYRSYADGFAPLNGSNVQSPTLDTACTNPAGLGGGKALFSATTLPLFANQPLFRVGMDLGLPITTPFAVFRDFYAGECVKDDRGKSYLKISVEPGAGDQRTNPIPFNSAVFAPSLLGTHILDYNFPLGDLISLVQQKANALRAAQASGN